MHANPEGEALLPKDSTGDSALCLIAEPNPATAMQAASLPEAICACRQRRACVFLPEFVFTLILHVALHII